MKRAQSGYFGILWHFLAAATGCQAVACMATPAEVGQAPSQPGSVLPPEGSAKKTGRPLVTAAAFPGRLAVPPSLDDADFRLHVDALLRRPPQEIFSDEEVRGWWNASADAGVMPEKDRRRHPKIEAMGVRRWVGGPQRENPAFNRSIPRVVHQLADPDLAFGEDTHHRAWAAWAERFGYAYQQWSSKDASTLLSPANFGLFRTLVARGERIAAGQVLAASVMAEHGGLWMGRHATPPTNDGIEVDLASFFPMKGMVAVTAPRSRLLSHVSTWVLWDALLACPHHPVLLRLQAQLPDVVLPDASIKPVEPAYLTGSVLLSEIMSGAHTLVPAHTARRIGLLLAVDLDR